MGGLRQLYSAFTRREPQLARPVRFHLIGHSAGAIVHTHLASQLIAADRSIDSMSLMAPAVRSDTFQLLVTPHLGERIKRLAGFILDDETEQQDKTVQALLGYGRSLLYLVSESFETERRHMPIVGMEKFFDAAVGKAPGVSRFISPGDKARATTHGGFDDDATTMKSVIAFIKESRR
jgi:pimeloyl-ACP methyl ester carboxylesterase